MRFKILLLISACSNVVHAASGALADPAIILSHLTVLTKTENYRTYSNIEQLNSTADYIQHIFQQYADTVFEQEFVVEGNRYKNVVCSFGVKNKKRIIIGAHYDVCGEQQGADDNASGVTGLLELARLLKDKPLNNRIDLVAFALEEPPFFRTCCMGSYVHAKSLFDNKTDVYGMISLEMIGYFSDKENSQDYPLKVLSKFYGTRGDYITLVKKWRAGTFANTFCEKFQERNDIKSKKFTGPALLQGIDFSDHLNYWNLGFSAIMITDTAFFRNKNYHETTDTLETLDIERMAKVIDTVYETVLIM